MLAAGGYLYFRLDDEIRRQVEHRFASHYHNFYVQVGSARFDPQRGIAINNLSLTPKDAVGRTQAPTLSVEELYLAGDLRVEQLLTNQMRIEDIVVRRASLRVVRQLDGTWNTSALLPLPHFSDSSPNITIEDATATIENAARPATRTFGLQGVNLKLEPLGVRESSVPANSRFHISGSASGLPAREFNIDGELGAADGSLNFLLTATGVDVSADLISNISSLATESPNDLAASGQANVSLRISRARSGAPLSWSGAFKLDRGRLTHASLPDALTDISLEGSADAQRLTIERMDAKCGAASITLALNRAGWSETAPLAASAKVVGFVLSERLQSTLPESYVRVWQRFRPIGPVDADIQVTFDGANWKPAVNATVRGISLTDMEKFPYILEQTTGKVAYRPRDNGAADELRLELTGLGAGRPIKIDAVLTHLAPTDPQGAITGSSVAIDQQPRVPGSHAAGYRGVRYTRAPHGHVRHPLGYVSVSGTDVPLHPQLLDALKPKVKELVSALHARGAVDFAFRAEWKDLEQPFATTTIDIPLRDCSLQYTPFPLPLQHLNGLVKLENNRWTLNDLEARGGSESTRIKCRGTAVPHDSGCELDLTFDATNVPLDENLRNALLSPGAQQAWDELRPQGTIDFTARATRQPNELEPNITVTLRPCEGTVSIEPRRLPYRLFELQGVAAYERGRVVWHNVIGRHDRSLYSVESGHWQATPDGGWQCDFKNVYVDRLATNRDFLEALPLALQNAIYKLQPTGTISLYKGNVSFAKPPQSELLTSSWDVSLECQQAAIQGTTPLRGINGGIRLIGRSDGLVAFTAGEFALDSILYQNVQLTNLRGPFWSDSVHCLIGEPACKQQNLPPRRLTADAYGGSIATNIELTHGVNPSYIVDLQLGAANLSRFASERLGGATNLNGTVSGKLAVAGTGNSMQTLRGRGELHVVDANIYQVPPLVAMLSVLRNRTPDTTAFNRCDMDFSIQGEHIHFDHCNLIGDAVSLYGSGEADLSRRLDLVFYTLIGPADLPIPLWKTIAGHVSQQGFQLKVGGTWEDPKVERKAFPAVNDMLNQLQTGIQDSAATISPMTATRESHSDR